jgi:hypothetical protein
MVFSLQYVMLDLTGTINLTGVQNRQCVANVADREENFFEGKCFSQKEVDGDSEQHEDQWLHDCRGLSH